MSRKNSQNEASGALASPMTQSGFNSETRKVTLNRGSFRFFSFFLGRGIVFLHLLVEHGPELGRRAKPLTEFLLLPFLGCGRNVCLQLGLLFRAPVRLVVFVGTHDVLDEYARLVWQFADAARESGPFRNDFHRRHFTGFRTHRYLQEEQTENRRTADKWL